MRRLWHFMSHLWIIGIKKIKVCSLYVLHIFLFLFLLHLDCLGEGSSSKSLGILVSKIFWLNQGAQEIEERVSHQIQFSEAKFILFPVCLVQGKPWIQRSLEWTVHTENLQSYLVQIKHQHCLRSGTSTHTPPQYCLFSQKGPHRPPSWIAWQWRGKSGGLSSDRKSSMGCRNTRLLCF